MFISIYNLNYFKSINLFHPLNSTYYSQNRWCAGNANLTAANIKKDITIFGVKGTYEGSVVWLIKNGDVASGLNVRWLKKSIPNDDANNWWREDITDNSGIAKRVVDNKTWRMLCHTWYSSNTTWNQLLAFRDIVGTKVKVSGSSRSDYTVQGVVGGDFWYDTGCTRLDANVGFQIWFGLNSNNADTTNKCWQTITPLRSSIIWAGTEFSFRQTGISTRSSGTMWCTYGDFAFYTHPSNDKYTTYLFAHNLWIDTSTIPS